MSVTIRDFAAPLLATVPVKAGIDAWFFELNLAALIWNGINRGMDRAALVRELMAFVPERDVGSIVDELMRRKADAFPRDRRCVLELEAYESSGRYEVMALSQRS